MGAIETLAAALHAACLRDLPDIEYIEVNHTSERRFLDTLAPEQRQVYYGERSKSMTDDERAKFYEARQIGFLVKTKRPFPDGCDVVMFPQSWPNTACGYDEGGGLCGQAFTNAYTVIVQCHSTGCAAVYFGSGRLAYLVPAEKQSELWHAKVSSHSLPSQSGAKDLGWYALTSHLVARAG
jgi:hypothetical protein